VNPTGTLTAEDIERFKEAGKEVCIETAAGYLVWIVPEHTGPADRVEITPEELLRPNIVQETELLAEALRLFGGRMLKIDR